MRPFRGFWRPAGGRGRGLEAVAVAFEREDLGVVNQAVDHPGGDDVVAEDLAPGAEGLVGGDDQARAFVARKTSMNIRFAACGSNGM